MEQEGNYIESNKRSFLSGLSEDIWAVFIGGLLIAVILAGVFFSDIKFSTTSLPMGNGNDLLAKVLTGSNLLLLAVIGIIFLFLSSAAVAAIRK
jgi:hypothetical protein